MTLYDSVVILIDVSRYCLALKLETVFVSWSRFWGFGHHGKTG